MEDLSLLQLRVVKERSIPYQIQSIRHPRDVDALARSLGLHEMAEESLLMLTLDTARHVTGVFFVSHGALDWTIVSPREIFKRALLQNAHSVILCHCHPSGDPTASQQDINVTRRLIDAGELLGVHVLDHVIVGDGFYSMREETGLAWP